jgi:dihydrofolate reductase
VAKIVASVVATFDGVVEDPAGVEDFERGGWMFDFDQGEDGRQIKLEEAFFTEAALMGRVTYEYLANHRATDDRLGIARKADAVPKYVVSSTLEEPEWENTTVLRGDVVSQVEMLKHQLEGDIVIPGSCQLVETLFEEDLLDEIRMMLYPVMLGEGRLFLPPDAGPKPMKLARAENVGQGICYFIFEPREWDEVSNAKNYEPRVI